MIFADFNFYQWHLEIGGWIFISFLFFFELLNKLPEFYFFMLL